MLGDYIAIKHKFCTDLPKIQKQLNSLTEAKSTTLKCTFIYKFIEMMKCHIDGIMTTFAYFQI